MNNENAQRFIIENFRRILAESEEIRERNRREKKKGAPRSARQGGGTPRPAAEAARKDDTNKWADGWDAPQADLPPAEELPPEYYEMLSSGWSSAGDDAPFL